VEEVGARELRADARAPEPVDRLAIKVVCLVALGEENAQRAPIPRPESVPLAWIACMSSWSALTES
jgi:hypothetical protein